MSRKIPSITEKDAQSFIDEYTSSFSAFSEDEINSMEQTNTALVNMIYTLINYKVEQNIIDTNIAQFYYYQCFYIYRLIEICFKRNNVSIPVVEVSNIEKATIKTNDIRAAMLEIIGAVRF